MILPLLLLVYLHIQVACLMITRRTEGGTDEEGYSQHEYDL
jgi:hypothetical protein